MKAKQLMAETAEAKGIDLVECETMVDHVHLLLRLDEKDRLPWAINMLKGVSSRRLAQAFPDLKEDGAVQTIWQHRYASKLDQRLLYLPLSTTSGLNGIGSKSMNVRNDAPAFRLEYGKSAESPNAVGFNPRYCDKWTTASALGPRLRLLRPSSRI